MPTVAEFKSASQVNDRMRTAASTLLCLSLLIHAMLGCCWHDMHEAGAAGDSSALAADSDCCHKHCCHHRDSANDGADSDAPCKNHPNCHGLCHYLPVQKTALDKSLLSAPIDLAVDIQATCDTQATALTFALATCESSPPPPVPLHLFHQILLI